MKASPEIKRAVKAMLQFHNEEIARNPVAGRCAKQLRRDMRAGRLEAPSRRRELIAQGHLCETHLLVERCLDGLFSAA